MKKHTYLIMAASLIMGVFGCQSGETNKNDMNKEVLDLSGVDSSVSPGENFFSYANGKWIKNTEIPADQTGWGSFYLVRDQALSNMKTIIDDCLATKNPKEGSIKQQVGDLYASAMDTSEIEKLGIQPLQANLDQIAKLENNQEVLHYILNQYTIGDDLLFSFGVGADDKNSKVQRPSFYQGGLGLPNNEYYLKQDAKSKEIRADYHQYIATLLKLANVGQAEQNNKYATDIINLETALAKASKTPVERRDPEANYHLLTAEQMNAIAPSFNWPAMLKTLKIEEDTLVVGQPDFYKAASQLLKTTPVEVWQKYLAFHTISGYASWLSSPFADAKFDFYSRKLNGQEEQDARWKRAASLVNGALGDALGKLYVEKYFPASSKKYMEGLVDNLRKAYAQKIKEADWMSETTKEKALDKLNAINLKIGYPDKWKDYSSIKISKNSLIDNLKAIGKWSYDDNLSKLGKPTDKTEWFMTPPTVNAYYNPSYNEIVFPAGILQPPFYFANGDDAVNYGGIGFVIGHEITHGFDDQGSQFDKDGNLKNWWTEEDREAYMARAKKVIDLYNGFTVLDSVHVNGELTQGENIADIGGLAIAYAAFKMTDEGKSDKKIDGLTPDQRFFMSCAQVWRIKTRDARMLWRINNDPHSPEMYRVNGPVSNMDSFYEAFGVKEGDKMFRAESERIKIW